MTTLSLNTFYLANDRTLSEIENGFALPVSTYLGKSIYGIVSVDSQVPIAIDINEVINRASDVALTDTYQKVIESYLTNVTQYNVLVSYFPRVNAQSGMYEHRMSVFDISSETGWNIDFGDIDTPSLISDLDMVGTLDDLVLTAPSGTVLSNILVSVNGILHRTSVCNGYIYVIDGFATIRQSGNAYICGMDTTTLGGHTIVPLTTDNLVIDPATFQSMITIKDDTVDFTGKSVLLSVDGYLRVFDDSYRLVDKSTVQVMTNRIDYIGNFIYSPILRSSSDAWNIRTQTNPYTGQTITYNEGNHQSDRNDQMVYIFADSTTTPVASFDTSEFLANRLTSQHSFLVVINNPYIFTKEYMLYSKGEFTMYECLSDDMPRGLLHYGRGYLLPYTSTFNLDTNYHLIFVNQDDQRSAAYVTGTNNPTYPAPWADWKNDRLHPHTKMIEIYSGTDNTD